MDVTTLIKSIEFSVNQLLNSEGAVEREALACVATLTSGYHVVGAPVESEVTTALARAQAKANTLQEIRTLIDLKVIDEAGIYIDQTTQ